MTQETADIDTTAPALAPSAQTFEASQSMNMSAALIDTLMERARRYPREMKKVQSTAFAELEFVPELAARSYYSIPYNQGKQNETRVEGPSIRSAMTLCRNWGNCFNQGRIASEEKSNIIAQGIFVDFETGAPTIRDIRVSKFYKPRGSQGVVPKNADMLYNSVQAGISKAVRNAILASLPDWLVSGYFNRAKELVINPPSSLGKPVISLQDRILKGKQLIARDFKVEMKAIEQYIAENAEEFQDDGQLLIHLQGLYTGFKEGQYRIAEVFGGAEPEPQTPAMPQEKPKA